VRPSFIDLYFEIAKQSQLEINLGLHGSSMRFALKVCL
jgi:hypothetical protein